MAHPVRSTQNKHEDTMFHIWSITTAYVFIIDSTTGIKNFGAAVQVNSRYCGARFGNVPDVTAAGALAHAHVYGNP